MNTRITTKIVGLLLAMFLVGEAFAQVPSTVTQQLRLSTGGTTPFYVNHRAMTGAGAAPGTNGWYAWDQVPTPVTGTNYLLFLNDANEVRRTSSFALAQANFITRVNAAGTNIEFVDPDALVTAQNGISELPTNIIELGGDLLHATTIDQDGFGMSFVNGNATTASTFTLGGGAGTLNTTIDPGVAGNLKLLNIDVSATPDETFLVLDAAGNVMSRPLSGMIDANNGVTEQVISGVSTVQLGAAATGGSTLLVERFVSLNGQNLNWEGAGNFNIGTGGNMSTNINTGATGNLTLQGTTLTQNTGALNFLYVDASNNVRRATADLLTTDPAPDMYMAISGTGEVVQAPNPMGGIYRGKIAGNGGYTYTSPAIANLDANAAIVCTIDNRTGVSGTVIVQVTGVTSGVNGTFNIECSENIQLGSSISYVVMNP